MSMKKINSGSPTSWLRLQLKLIVLISGFWLSTEVANAQTDFVTYLADSSFTVSVPDYLVEVNDLNGQANLQFANYFNETYMMVMAEEKISNISIEGLEDMDHQFENGILDRGGHVYPRSTLSVNSNQAIQHLVDMTIGGIQLSYLVTFIETSNCYYKIYCWTLASQMKDFVKDFSKTVLSFREEGKVGKL